MGANLFEQNLTYIFMSIIVFFAKKPYIIEAMNFLLQEPIKNEIVFEAAKILPTVIRGASVAVGV